MILQTPEDQRIYEEELRPLLPRQIFDAHVHVWDADAFPGGFAFPPQDCCARFGGTFTLAQWRGIMKEILPDNEPWINCFGTPHRLYDRDKVPPVNRRTEFAEVIVSPEDSAETMARRIEESHAVGVKPYLNYAALFYGKPDSQVEVREMLTPEQLQYLDAHKRTVTFHIPRSGRFADPLNPRQMLEICEKYPNIRMIFAHIGRAYFMKNIRESNIADFVQFPNVYFDTAMLNNAELLKYAFDHFPAERILFGSDSPIALLHGKSVEINNQYAYLMGEDYRIGTAIYDQSHAVRFTTFFYEQLRGILQAATTRKMREDVLFNNARKLFAEAQADA